MGDCFCCLFISAHAKVHKWILKQYIELVAFKSINLKQKQNFEMWQLPLNTCKFPIHMWQYTKLNSGHFYILSTVAKRLKYCDVCVICCAFDCFVPLIGDSDWSLNTVIIVDTNMRCYIFQQTLCCCFPNYCHIHPDFVF